MSSWAFAATSLACRFYSPLHSVVLPLSVFVRGFVINLLLGNAATGSYSDVVVGVALVEIVRKLLVVVDFARVLLGIASLLGIFSGCSFQIGRHVTRDISFVVAQSVQSHRKCRSAKERVQVAMERTF